MDRSYAIKILICNYFVQFDTLFIEEINIWYVSQSVHNSKCSKYNIDIYKTNIYNTQHIWYNATTSKN